ncbi:MAG: hypothetical protein AB8B65_01420 [Kordia sp.]|uniref:hypothetical protein n=1 Tax=Kordia sp. TaxID=1965332 RepID=UPI00385EB572
MEYQESGHKMEASQMKSYLKRQIAYNTKWIIGIMSVFLLLMFWFTYSYRVHTFVMLPLTIILCAIILIVYFLSFIQLKNIAQKTTYFISETKIEKIVSTNELNFANQLAQARQERRYGVKANQSFPIHEIESTKIKPNEIVIKSFDYNLFTFNGKIVIPKEINDYNSVKAFILANAKKFKLNS